MNQPVDTAQPQAIGAQTDAAGRTVHEIHKELSKSQKVLTMGKGLIELDMRQGALLGGALLGSYLPYAVFGLAWPWAVGIAVALMTFSATLAFVPVHGKYLESWAYNLLLSLVTPKEMVYRADNAGVGATGESAAKGGRRRREVRAVRNAIQKKLPQESIHHDIQRRKDGVWLMAAEATPVNVSFHDPGRAEALRADIAENLDQLDFPYQELTDMRRSSLTAYATSVERRVAERARDNPALEHFAAQHTSFLNSFSEERDTRDRRTYVVIPYDATFERHREAARGYGRNVGRVASITSSLSRMFAPLIPASRKAAGLQQEADAARDQLLERATAAQRAYSSFGVELRILEGGELLRVLKDLMAFDADAHSIPEGAPNPRLYTPVTLDEGAWARLSEKGFDQALHKSQEVRRSAAPAMGIGELSVVEPSVADKTAPGYVRVENDRIYVNDTVRTVLFVKTLPPRPYSGILDTLLTEVSGRIRISKHISQKDPEEIENTLSVRIQDLEDAEDDSELGSAKNKKEREIALRSARYAHDRLRNDDERYFELSTYIQLEADSDSELDALVSTVKRTLSRWHGETTKAYVEMWQAYVSCLPMADDRLQKRYVSKGIMTDALSCLHTFGSTQIRHPGGILVGEKLSGDATHPPLAASDKRSQSRSSLGQRPGDGHVIVNPRKFANPHWLITGIPGSGKTHAAKGIISREYMNGKRVRGIDPVGDSGYRQVTQAVGGQDVLIAPGSPHHFNPCEITQNYANLQLLQAADRMDPGPARERAFERAYAERLAGKKRFLNGMLSTMCANPDGSGALTTAQEGLTEMLWDLSYESCNITDDPETHSSTPPTFATFFHFLRENLNRYPELAEIRRKLASWEKGALKDLFAYQSNIDLTNPWVFFQLGLADNKREQAAVTFAVMDFLSGDISDRSSRDVVPVDELWRPLGYEGARGYMEEYWRTARARATQMIGISHSLTEFKGSQEGRSILDLSTIQLLMRQEQTSVIEAMRHEYSLDPRNAADLARLEPGVGYLRLSGGTQIRVYVACSEEEMELFDTSDTADEDFEVGELGDYLESATVLDSDSYLAAEREIEPAQTVPELPEAPAQDEPAGAGDGPQPPEHAALPAPAEEEAPEEASKEAPADGAAAPRVVAIAGSEASTAAFEAAGLLSSRAREHGKSVLLVDTEGKITDRLRQAGAPVTTPDHLLAGEGAAGEASEGDPGQCILTHPATSLAVFPCPKDTSLSGGALLDWARGSFDAVVICASANSRYGKGWLVAADRVAVSSARSRTLENARRSAERIRGTNGTVLAPMGNLKLESAHGRPLAVLPSAGNEVLAGAREGATFAFLQDPSVAEAFGGLLRELLSPEPAHHDEEEPEIQATAPQTPGERG